MRSVFVGLLLGASAACAEERGCSRASVDVIESVAAVDVIVARLALERSHVGVPLEHIDPSLRVGRAPLVADAPIGNVIARDVLAERAHIARRPRRR